MLRICENNKYFLKYKSFNRRSESIHVIASVIDQLDTPFKVENKSVL